MALKKLVEVWDGKNLIESNIEFLKQKTKEVHRPFTDETKQILNDLLDVYKATPCAGVAANQIGYSKRIFIGLKHDVSDNKDNSNAIGNPNANNYEFYINPQIDHSSNKSIQECEEGCLSVPEIRLMTERFDKIKVRYFNQNGDKIKKPLKGFLSLLFQHELDHLNGILMVENSKIKQIYQISDNQKLSDLYNQLITYINDN